jgi:transcription antitermination factor NusG
VKVAENSNPMVNDCCVSNWHALFTRYQHEKPVALALSSKNYEVYLPLCNSTRQWQDRSKQVWSPLFPSYVFVRGGMDRPLQIVSTPGVIHIVRFGRWPAVIPEAQVDAVKKILKSHAAVEPHPYLTCGDRVRVKSGALAGLEGILIREKKLPHLVISMQMLGRSAAVEVEMSNVERVGLLRSEVASSRNDRFRLKNDDVMHKSSGQQWNA